MNNYIKRVEKTGMKNKLFNKNFVLLWQGQLVSQLGSQAFHIGMIFWIKEVTGSASLLGILLMVSTIPGIVLGPFGGTLSDRASRKKVIVLCDLINGIVVTSFALMVWFSVPEAALLVALFMVSVMVATAKAFFEPAVLSSIPNIVPKEKVEKANSLIQVSTQLAIFLGQGIGGVCFRILGAPVLFLVDGISYLVSAFSESFMVFAHEKSRAKVVLSKARKWKSFITETGDGFQYIWKNNGLRTVFLVITCISFFLAPLVLFLPFFIEDDLKLSPDWYGYVMACFGAGAVLGYLGAGSVNFKGKTRQVAISLAWLAMGILVVLLGVVNEIVLIMLFVFIIGLCNGFNYISIITLIQFNTDEKMRGRVFGNLTTFTEGITPISYGAAGIVLDMAQQNVRLMFIAVGAIMLLIVISASFNKHFRAFLSFVPKVPSEPVIPDKEEVVDPSELELVNSEEFEIIDVIKTNK
ncbi:MFS transporter [Fulvivirga sediminis]|uniref:MFS transporter n=1 Tax=Fulvivirga sediminis TaxID=2803949 RepID=A0A937K0C5_9BACT|nr:MFS transporter [Fulvivirga sediminis]MBL3657519.1 MFS transporter [Fulvivirga sediminis]